MRVHIPEAGNEKLSPAVHSPRSARHGDPPADIGDPISLRHHRHGGLPRAAGRIDERHVHDRDRAVLLARRLAWRQRSASHDEKG